MLSVRKNNMSVFLRAEKRARFQEISDLPITILRQNA